MFVQVEKARATGLLRDDGASPRTTRAARLAASMAKAAASDCQRLVCKEGIQIHGGMGYTWESDVQLFVKRAKTLEALFGTGRAAPPAHRRPARDLTCSSTTTPTTEEFRSELRAWLDANQPTLEEMRAEPVTSSAHLTGWSRRWQRRLFDAGLLVPGWPPELGGRNLPPVQQLVYHEEMAKIPVDAHHQSAGPRDHRAVDPRLRQRAS